MDLVMILLAVPRRGRSPRGRGPLLARDLAPADSAHAPLVALVEEQVERAVDSMAEVGAGAKGGLTPDFLTLSDMHEVWDHPQLRARERWVSVNTPAGSIPALLPPGIPDHVTPHVDAVPSFGEHTESILAELGLDAAAIGILREARAI